MPSHRYNLRKNPKPSATQITPDMLNFSDSEADDDFVTSQRPTKKREVVVSESTNKSDSNDEDETMSDDEEEEDTESEAEDRVAAPRCGLSQVRVGHDPQSEGSPHPRTP